LVARRQIGQPLEAHHDKPFLLGLVVVHAGPPEAVAGRKRGSSTLLAAPPISALLGDLGNFEFADAATGSYVLEVDVFENLVVIETLRLD
jgi:hypothetical protein